MFTKDLSLEAGDVMDRRTALQHSLLGGLALAGAVLVSSLPTAAAAAESDKVRLIVTVNNADGKSYIVKDELVPRGVIWSHTAEMTMGPGAPTDPKTILPTSMPALDPTPGGARCLYTSFPQSKKQKGEPIDRTLGKDGFHRTFTIDYTFILGGEVTMFLDIGQTDVKAGDVVIQRNTAHAWHNYSATPTSLVALLVRV